MVKTKQQKSRPKKQPRVKKQGKQEDISQFRAQFDALGLQIVQVTADGNCFFRALADQLEGNEEEHAKYRSMVVQYISKNQEMFEPFIEDDVPFDEYCHTMEKDGTWAGHMELQSASLVTHCNICIHRCLSPRWYIKNFDEHGARMIHLSYHDGEHYNSVRLKEDPCKLAAMPILIKVDADISASSNQAKASVCKSKGGSGRGSTIPGSVKLVMAGSGCGSAEKVEKVLLEVDGDIDAAIEFLVAEQGTEDYSERDDLVTCNMDSSLGSDCEKVKKDEDTEEQKSKQDLSIETSKQKHDNSKLDEVVFVYRDENAILQSHGRREFSHVATFPSRFFLELQKISRNKDCPCGSKKKYKSCCGTGAGRPSTKFLINQTVDVRKGRKERKQSRKGGPAKSPVLSGHDGGPPDMGALCI